MSAWVEIVCDNCAVVWGGMHPKKGVPIRIIRGLRHDAKGDGWVSKPDPNTDGWIRDLCPSCVKAGAK